MSVALLAPEWDRACADCERHVFREDGAPALRNGRPVPRPPGAPTPCHKCAKVPLAVRESGAGWAACRPHARELTPANRRAWAFYRRCRATGRFPDDPLVAAAAAVLVEVERRAERAPLDRLNANLELLTLALARKAR